MWKGGNGRISDKGCQLKSELLKIKLNPFRLSLNLLRRDWCAGEWRVLLILRWADKFRACF